jgi:transposase InsO family protein
MDALLMAVWFRQLKESVLVHFDQGTQYICHDNAVVESFLSSLKLERVRKRSILHAQQPIWICCNILRVIRITKGNTATKEAFRLNGSIDNKFRKLSPV